jgi:plastocyanin domain-containing protein
MRGWTVAVGMLVALAGCKGGGSPPTASEGTPSRAAAAPRRVALAVTTEGFVPDTVPLKVDEPVVLVVTRTTDETCATELRIEGTEVRQALPLDHPVEVAYTARKAGKVKFGCAMEMMVSGVLVAE